MEIREFKNFMVVFLLLCFFKFLFTHDFSTSNEVKTVKPTKTIISRIKYVKKEVCRVVATMYYAVEGQCDSDPYITACMYKINPNKASEHKWIAVSRDLLKKFHYGQKVRISGCGKKDGIYVVADTMNKRFRNKIDILETQGTPIYKFENVKIFAV